jgi:predicted DCC family thiol-disulfide oxidoreductase YuxK
VTPANDHPIVLFDGVCNFCDASVNFIIRHDRRGRFQFAPLQSDVGKELRAKHGLERQRLETLVLIERGVAYTRSTAALRIAKRLSGPHSLLYALIAIPEPVRDAAYNWFARHRYQWFGRRDECAIPAANVGSRFLAE